MTIDFINEYKEKINNALENFFDSKRKEYTLPEHEEAFNQLYDFTMRGGKRIRPLFAICTAKCFNTQLSQEHLIKASLPFELIQTYLLIHDDIMDRDEFRRGKPTVHSYYEKKFGDAYFGNSMAINIGDLASSFVKQPLNEIPFIIQKKPHLLNIFDKLLELEIKGQISDVYFEKTNPDAEQILNMYSLKTSPYTTIYPMIFGASLGNASQKELDLIEVYSEYLGLAFQLNDDYLGIFGDFEKMGKPIGSDIVQGKKTYLILKALENGNKKFKKEFLKVWGNPNAKPEDLEKTIKLMKLDGIDKIISREKNEFVNNALDGLKKMKMEKEYLIKLIDLSKYLADRNY